MANKKRIPYVVDADLIKNKTHVCSVSGKSCKCKDGKGCSSKRKKKVKVY